MQGILKLILLLTFAISLIVFSNCKQYTMNQEIREVDTLMNYLLIAEETLVINENYINERIDSMKIKIAFINHLDTLKMNQELLFDKTSYQALLNNYQKFISAYDVIRYDNIIYKNQIDSLRNHILENKISKQRFHEVYETLKPQIENHVKNSKSIIKTIISTEEMYKRTDRKITDFYLIQKKLHGTENR